MKLITAAAVALLLGGCATMQQPKPSIPKAAKVVKHQAPCACSPTANEEVKKRWFNGWKIRFLH